MKHPEYVDIVIFREKTEDIYTGIEFQYGSEDHKKFMNLFKKGFDTEYGAMRFPESSGVRIKPISMEGTERLVRAAIQWAMENNRRSVTFVHKGNGMTHSEGAFLKWGYALAKREFRDQIVTERETLILGNKEANPELSVEDNARMIFSGYPLMSPEQQKGARREVEEALQLVGTHGNGQWKNKLLIKDTYTDLAMKSEITRPFDYDVIATMNLNGDYISDEIAALVGGIEAADLIFKGMEGANGAKTVTYDFERLMEGGTLLKCSQFGDAIIKNMN